MTASDVHIAAKATKLEWRQVLSLSAANFSQAVMLTMPFTIGVFMVRDFQRERTGQQEVDEQVVGRLTGLLAGVFSFSSFLTAYAWGWLSNYTGRKPVIVVGNAVSLISMIWFGASGSYGTAIAARAFGGFFNGILGAWKCMIAESTETLLQGKFFGYMSLAWGLGCIAGPAMGGIFSRPCEQYGHGIALCREGQLFRERCAAFLGLCRALPATAQPAQPTAFSLLILMGCRPYLMACLIGSITLTAAVLLSIFMLKETLQPQHRRRFRRRGAGSSSADADEQQALVGSGGAPLSDGSELPATAATGAAATDASHWSAASGDGSSSSMRALRTAGGARSGAAGEIGAADADEVVAMRSPRSLRMQYMFRLASRAFVRRTMLEEDAEGGSGADRSSGGDGDKASLLQVGAARSATVDGSNNNNNGTAAAVARVQLVHSPASSPADARRQEKAPNEQQSPYCTVPHYSASEVDGDGASGEEGARLLAPGPPDDGPALMPVQRLVDGAAAQQRSVELAVTQDSSDSGAGHRLSDSQCRSVRIAERHATPAVFCGSGGTHAHASGEPNHCQAGCSDSTFPSCSAAEREGSSPPHQQRLSTAHAAAVRQDQDAQPSQPHEPGANSRSPSQATHGSAALPAVPPRYSQPDADVAAVIIDVEPNVGHDHVSTRSGGGSATVPVAADEAPDGDDGGGQGSGERKALAHVAAWYRDRMVVLTILGYGLVALLFCALDETFPIYAAATAASGGLGMRENQIAGPLMFFGVVLMVYSVWGFPPLQRHVGTLRMTRVGLVTAVATCLLIPLVNTALGHKALALVLLYGSMVIKAFSQCSAFTGAIIMVNAAPRPDQLGDVNGVGQTLAALVRGIGPAMGGILWAASLGLHSAGQQFLTFGMIALVSVVTLLVFAFVRVPKALR